MGWRCRSRRRRRHPDRRARSCHHSTTTRRYFYQGKGTTRSRLFATRTWLTVVYLTRRLRERQAQEQCDDITIANNQAEPASVSNAGRRTSPQQYFSAQARKAYSAADKAYCLQCSRYAFSWLATRSTTLVHSHDGASSILERSCCNSDSHLVRVSSSICLA